MLSKAHERSLGHKGLLGLAQQQRLDRVAHILVGYCRKGPVEPLTVGSRCARRPQKHLQLLAHAPARVLFAEVRLRHELILLLRRRLRAAVVRCCKFLLGVGGMAALILDALHHIDGGQAHLLHDAAYELAHFSVLSLEHARRRRILGIQLHRACNGALVILEHLKPFAQALLYLLAEPRSPRRRDVLCQHVLSKGVHRHLLLLPHPRTDHGNQVIAAEFLELDGLQHTLNDIRLLASRYAGQPILELLQRHLAVCVLVHLFEQCFQRGFVNIIAKCALPLLVRQVSGTVYVGACKVSFDVLREALPQATHSCVR